MVQTTPELDLDRIDRRIIGRLAKDGRITWRGLATDVGLSLTPTLRRVRRLEAAGYIKGYSAVLDEGRLLGSMTVFVSVTLERQREEALAEFEAAVEPMSEVIGGFLMSGESDYLLHVLVQNLEHYENILARLTRTPAVAHIQSSFALRSFIRRSAVPF